MKHLGFWLMFLVVLLFSSGGNAEQGFFCGDCNGDNQVRVNELVISVVNSLDGCCDQVCCGDCDESGNVEISELVRAVSGALSYQFIMGECGLGCAGPCYSPIPGDPPCPCGDAECVEFPEISVEGGELICSISVCERVTLRNCLEKVDGLFYGACHTEDF